MSEGKMMPENQAERYIEKDSYQDSSLIAKFRERQAADQPIRAAFVDIDSTLTGNPDEAIRVQKLLAEQGFVTVFVTSRTAEMAISRAEYEKSVQRGFDRPAPHMGTENGKRITAFADELSEHTGLYNPDVIAATTGARIVVHQKDGGYQDDIRFNRTLKTESAAWRGQARAAIDLLDPEQKLFKLAPIESKENFEKGQTDVYPPDFRIQLNIITPEASVTPQSTGNTEGGVKVSEDLMMTGLDQKNEVLRRFDELKFGPKDYQQEAGLLLKATSEQIKDLKDRLSPEEYQRKAKEYEVEYRQQLAELRRRHVVNTELMKQLQNVRIIDDSNPEKGRYSLYVLPNKGYKARAVEHVTKTVAEEVRMPKNDIELLIIGDSFPDVSMGLYGGVGTKATFLVVGGSRLTDVFTNPAESTFAGEDFSAIKRRLLEIGEGEYLFRAPGGGERKVIIGDKAHPGTKGPETISAYLTNARDPLEFQK